MRAMHAGLFRSSLGGSCALAGASIAALAALFFWSGAAMAVVSRPPAVTCSAANCQACLEYSGPGNRCVKCRRLESCEINKGGGPRSQSPIGKEALARSDVDIHAGPGGQFGVIGMMRKNQEAPVFEIHRHGWAKLLFPASAGFPRGGFGWVASDHLRFLIVK